MSLFVWTCCSKLLSVEYQQANIDKDNLAHEVAKLRLEALRQTEQALKDGKDLTIEKNQFTMENDTKKAEKKDLEENLTELNEQPSVDNQASQTVQTTKTTVLKNDTLNAKCKKLEDDLKNERFLSDGILNQLKKSQENNEHLQSEFADLMKQNEVMGQNLARQLHKIKQLEKENNELANLNEITYFTLQWNKQKQA